MTPEERATARQECFRKRAYTDERIARRALRNAIERGFSDMHVYTCPHCGQYHLGHVPRGGAPAA